MKKEALGLYVIRGSAPTVLMTHDIYGPVAVKRAYRIFYLT